MAWAGKKKCLSIFPLESTLGVDRLKRKITYYDTTDMVRCWPINIGDVIFVINNLERTIWNQIFSLYFQCYISYISYGYHISYMFHVNERVSLWWLYLIVVLDWCLMQPNWKSKSKFDHLVKNMNEESVQ